jgi:hypothetical protein
MKTQLFGATIFVAIYPTEVFLGEERPMTLREVDLDASLYFRVGPRHQGIARNDKPV